MVFQSEVCALTASIPWALTHGRREDRPRVFGAADELAKRGLKPEYTAQQAQSILRACQDYIRMAEAGCLSKWSKVILKRPGNTGADQMDVDVQQKLEARRQDHLQELAKIVLAGAPDESEVHAVVA